MGLHRISLILVLDFRNITQFRFKFASVLNINFFFQTFTHSLNCSKFYQSNQCTLLSFKHHVHHLFYWLEYCMIYSHHTKSYIRIFSCFWKRICTLYELYYSPDNKGWNETLSDSKFIITVNKFPNGSYLHLHIYHPWAKP